MLTKFVLFDRSLDEITLQGKDGDEITLLTISGGCEEVKLRE
jgi:hypothetical protein